jgi:hypothetical protein
MPLPLPAARGRALLIDAVGLARRGPAKMQRHSRLNPAIELVE